MGAGVVYLTFYCLHEYLHSNRTTCCIPSVLFDKPELSVLTESTPRNGTSEKYSQLERNNKIG